MKLYENYEFKINVSKLQLPHFANFAESMPYVNFLYVYKEKFMPVMTLIYYPLVLIAGIIAVILFRKMVMSKINTITQILSATKQTSV